MKYVLVVATNHYVVKEEGSKEELDNIITNVFENRFYLHRDEEVERYIPIENIRFMDILTEDQLRKNIEEARKAEAVHKREMQESQPEKKDNILLFPGKYRQ